MERQTAPTCVRIERSPEYRGKQGLEYFAGVCAQTTGSQKLCLHLVTIPPLARAKPHLHESHERAVYLLSGEAGRWYGEHLREHMWLHVGDFLYIPANMPHLPYNASDSVPCVGVIARDCLFVGHASACPGERSSPSAFDSHRRTRGPAGQALSMSHQLP
jgi:uncharacterized RmlC-like cupin family protein